MNRWWATHRSDAVCLSGLASAAFGLGTLVFAQLSPERIWLYSTMFGPAVMVAAGHGWVEPVVAPGSALQRFLKQETDQFDANTLPEDPPRAKAVSRLAEQHKYLLLSTAAIWRIFGISWTSVALLAGLLYTLSAVFHYGLFRLISGTVPAGLMAIFLVLSPTQLIMLSDFRDYSKAPFIVGGIWALGQLVMAKPGAARGIAWSLALGIVTGAGMGFRQDVLIFVPFCVLVLPFISENTSRGGWLLRTARPVAFCAAFFAAAYGALSGSREEGTGLFHNATMGLISPFGATAGLTDASYSHGYVYKDGSTMSIIRNHTYRAKLRAAQRDGLVLTPDLIEPIPWVGAKYDDACTSYYLDYMIAFPWDFMMRWYGAMLRVLDFVPLSPHGSDGVLTLDRLDVEARWMEIRWDALGPLYGTGKYLFAAAVLLAGGVRIRYGLMLALFVLYFAGTTSLQFDTRHYFHLEFVYWWTMLFLVQMMWVGMSRLSKRRAEAVGYAISVSRLARRGTITAAILAAILGLPLSAAWAVQSRNVGMLAQQWHVAALEKITVTPEAERYGKVLIPGPQLLDVSRANEAEMSWADHAEYIVLEFEGSGEVIPIDFEFSPEFSHSNYSHRLNVRLPSTTEKQRLRLFVPLYFGRDSSPEGIAAWFKGISFPEWYLPNLVNVARVVDVTPFPFLLYAAVPEDINYFRRGLQLRGENGPYYVRERRADRENLLANGGFERWNMEGPVPVLEDFGAPGDSTLEPEASRRVEGRYAARQVWSGSDAGNSMREQFHIEVRNRRPNTSYELFLRACNFGDAEVVFHAAELMSDPDGATVQREVGTYFLRVPPGRSFSQFHASVHTGPGESWTLMFSIYHGEASGAAAVWDDFRLVEREEPTL